MRVVPGDSVRVVRGLYRDVPGKVEKVIPGRGVVMSGTKKEKTAGDSYDVYINPSNMIITSLNTRDSWRESKLKKEKSRPVKGQGRESDDITETAKTRTDTDSDDAFADAKAGMRHMLFRNASDTNRDDSLDDGDRDKKGSDDEELKR